LKTAILACSLYIAAVLLAGAEDLVCKFKLDPGQKIGNSGSSLRLEYNVNGENAFNGFWMKLGPGDRGNNFDASGFAKLTMWVKGDKAAGMPAKFKVEVKGDAGDVIGQYYVGNLTPEWTHVEIPLEIYAKQGIELAALNELTIGFERKSALPGVKGAIWVDDIRLEGGGDPKLLADFNGGDANNLGGKWGTYTP
jgi:hypothetical protein